MSIYGSVHTHFESQFDTGNDLKDMCKEFQKLGCRKVAVTEHGAFSSFEDLRDIASEMQDFDIIPGVEGYFGENASHMVLVAKNYKGYQSLCRIITESNRNMSGSKPIITLENLEKNVSKGDLFCTTACIAGIFGESLGLDRDNLEKKIQPLEKEIADANYVEICNIENDYLETLALSKKKLGQKRKNAEAAFKKYGNIKALQNVEEMEKEVEAAKEKLVARAEEFAKNHERYTTLNKQGFSRKAKKLAELLEEKRKLPDEEKVFRKNRALYNRLVKIFGKQDFYFELQNHGLASEAVIYNNLIEFAKAVGHTNFIASNDIHVGCSKADEEKYNKMLLRRELIKFTRFNKYEPRPEDDYEYYIKTNEELKTELLKIIDDEALIDGALANIEKSLSECEIEFPKNEKYYPVFCEDENAEFEKQIREGIAWRFPNGMDKEHWERLLYEKNIIKNMGYVGYHLIVADYLKYSRLLGYLPENEIENAPLTIEGLEKIINDRNLPKEGYKVGPGRGSAAGSEVCYVLGITDIDPLEYDLLFERFLNTERVSMPDIDSDFAMVVREKAIEYCKHRYGERNVCQIITKSYGALKGNIRLAARYFGSKECYEKGVDPKKPEGKALMKRWYTLGDILAKKVVLSDDGVEVVDGEFASDTEKKLFEYASAMDGAFTGYGQHAAGTIISGCDLTNIIPLMYNEKKRNFETQCTMTQAEEKGVLKMDFLGLKTLNIISDIMKETKDIRLQDPVLRKELLADKHVFETIFQQGLTQGVFQYESPGMKGMLRDFGPECFEDLILLVAAYRPGPMDYIPEIVAQKWFNKVNGDYQAYSEIIRKLYPFSKEEYDRKKEKKLAYFYDENGRVLPEIPHSISLKNDVLSEILASTYGCPIYQEQIMQIFQRMAGYSLGGADVVRRYMSKKKSDKLAKEKEAFIFGDEKRNIPGCMKLHGLTEKEADDLFEQMMPFAKYGFNKSHAAAYALVAYFTAYQKCYYPAVFYAVSLNYTENIDEISALVKEISLFHVKLLPPSLLLSAGRFTTEGENAVRFGLGYIKSLSEKDFIALPNPVDFIYANYDLGATVIEKYIRCGLFDDYCANRQQLVEWFNNNGDKIIQICKKHKEIEELRVDEEDPGVLKKIRSREDKISELERSLTSVSSYAHISEDVAENRCFEKENLGTVFSIKDSLSLLNSQSNNVGFEVLKEKDASVNAIVLSCIGPKYTKNTGTSYYEAVLMDYQGNEITRRFDAPIEVLEGRFYLTSDEKKFFLNRVKNIRLLRTRTYFLEHAEEQTIRQLQCPEGNVKVCFKDNRFLSIQTTESRINELSGVPGFYLDFM